MTSRESSPNNSEAIALVIAGLMERPDLTVEGPVTDERGNAYIHLRFDEGLSFQVVVMEFNDERNVG